MIKIILVFLIATVAFRLGFFYFSPMHVENGQQVTFQAVLLEDSKTLGSSQQFSLRYGNFWQSTKIFISTKDDQEFSYGQTLELVGVIKDRLLKNKQVAMTIQNPQIKAKNSGFLPLFGSFRQRIIAFCENNFSQPYSGLLVGIIFGIKSLLTDGITRSFRITGLSHIVAASGMNVTLLTGFLFTLLGSFLRRQVAISASLCGIFLYVCISGFDASIVRAALMGSIAFSASLFGRQYSGLYMLFVVGAGMLLWDPLLFTDVGFQLSVLATAGILLLSHSARATPLAFLGDDVGTTLAAQVATLPVVLATFGQYSLLSLIPNMLVLWTIPLIMSVGSVGILLGLISEPLGRIVVSSIIPLLWYMEKVTTFFSTHAVLVQIESLPVFFIVGYYLFLGGLLLFLQRKKIN